MSKDTDIRLTRKHLILETRQDQIERNLAAVAGGKRYIDLRLSRFPSESDSSWFGSTNATLTSILSGTRDVPGRKDRAYNINYPGRITTKLGQYVFGNPIERENANTDFAQDVTRDGVSINEFMEDVCEKYTASGWCWVQADRGAAMLDESGNPLPRTRAQRQANGDRVYWILWDALSVVDWNYSDSDGKLNWLITETQIYRNDDPAAKPTNLKVRTLWQRGGVGNRWYLDGDTLVKEEPITYAGAEIPFHMVGEADAGPHWFDDVEILQSAILNLLSADQESLMEAVFPQLVIPYGLIESIMESAKIEYKQAVEMVRGLNYPIFEPSESKGITRYIQPSKDGMKTIPERIKELRGELFDVVGLAMSGNAESKQVQSAESKHWDHLDPESTLKSLSGKLQAAEVELVQFSKQLDSEFEEWEPAYPMKFDIDDVESLSKSLMEIGAMPLPPEADKELQKAALKVLSKITPITPQRMSELMQEIESYDPALRSITQSRPITDEDDTNAD